MKLPAASCGVSQNSILKTSRNSENLSEAEANPVASYGESQVDQCVRRLVKHSVEILHE